METLSQLTSPQIQARETALAVRSYYRAVARNLGARLDTRAPIDDVTWLPPEAVWLAFGVAPTRDLTADEQAAATEALTAGTAAAPAVRFVVENNADTWVHTYIDTIRAGMSGVADESRLRLAVDADASYRQHLAAAIDVLKAVWPAAAVEFALIIRQVVILEDTELTASHDQMFGTIFSGSVYLGTVPAAYEMLLHETGHHSLFLRLAFTNLVTNPDVLVTHPLRNDPRPISGTLHAAFVLWRIYQGLRLWAGSGRAAVTGEVHDRCAAAREKLLVTLRTLADNAKWTADGQVLFDELCTLAGFDNTPVRI